MGNETVKPNYLKRYIVSAYILVNAMIIVVAGTMILILHMGDRPVIMWLVRNVIAWSPTYCLLLGWKYFRPDETRMSLVKRCFSAKIKPLTLIGSFCITFGMSMLSIFILSCIKGRSVMSYFDFGTIPLAFSLLLTITSGPTGEELGWRGFMREEFNKRYGFLKSGICQGLVWTFWHTLLWAVDTEFTGWSRLIYIIANIVVTTSITIIMNIVLEKHNNLLYSIMIHFGFNVIYMFLDMEIEFCIILTVLYLIVTPVAVLIRNKNAEKPTAEA